MNGPDVRRIVGEVRSALLMGEGSDHVAWLVNDELVVRQAKRPDASALLREAAVLDMVQRYATLPVPEVASIDPDAGILAYRHLPGTPLIDVPECDLGEIAAPLGAFLGAIHGIPLAEAERIVAPDNAPLADWLTEATETYPTIAAHLPREAGARIDAFLASPPPPEPQTMTFCHNDFGAEHILVDPGTMRITGIIDWADAAIADPMRDLALVLRDLGPDALDAALAAYRRPLAPDDRERLVFHARCKLVEDLAYGIETGATRYVDAALAHLGWTFT